MIEFVAHEEIDTVKWDRVITRSDNGRIYGYSWYLDTVSPDWDGLVLNDYEAIMPIPSREKGPFEYIYPPFWTQQLGVYSTVEMNAALYREFLNAIPKRFRFMEMYGNAGMKSFSDERVRVEWRDNFELDLNQSYEAIYESYNKNTRRNIKKSKEGKLSRMTDVDPESLIYTFRNHRGAEFSHFTDDDYNRLKHLMYVTMHRGLGSAQAVYDETNTLVAGAFFAYFHNRVVFLFSCNTPTGMDKRAMFYLLDEFIIEHSSHPLHLDFEGSVDPNLARFYGGFGAENYPYPKLVWNRLPWYIRWIK